MGATTNKTPARGTAASERNSGAASSNSPKYAISRSTRRSAGSLSKEIGASSSERKADDAPIGRIVVKGDRRIVLGAKSGQVWFAPLFGSRREHCRLRARRLEQNLLFGLRILPAHPSQPFTHSGLTDAEPPRDLAVGMSLALEPLYASSERHPQASLRIAAGLTQRGHGAVIKTLLVPAHRASRTIEGPRNIVLIGPS